MTGLPVRIRDLSFTYPGSPDPALRHLSLDARAGERVAILGPNGSGKTTLALHVNGLLDLQAGTIHVGDTRLTPESLADIRRLVGTVFQDPDDQLFMPTVRDDVAFGPANLGLAGPPLEQAVARALEVTGVRALAERAPHHLSGGEKRRAAIASVLSMTPEVLVLDEPTAGLDPRGRRQLASLLVSFDQTALVVTHDLPFALETCGRAVILGEGRVVADGATAALLRDHDLLADHGLDLPFGFELSSETTAGVAQGWSGFSPRAS